MAIAVTPQIYGAYGRGLIGPGYWTQEIVARLQTGTSLSQAKAALAATWPQSAEFINFRGLKPDLIPAGTGWTELLEEFEKPLLVLRTPTVPA